jgi:hypothetical protein
VITSLFLAVIVLSALAGFLLGVIGGGGGGLYVIVLTFVLGLPVKEAIGTALALSTITALAGVVGHWHSGNVDRPSMPVLGTTGVVGVLCGAYVAQLLSADLLKYLMVATFILTGIVSLAKTNHSENTRANRAKPRLGLLIPAGLVTGIVGGAFGLGASTPLSALLVAFQDMSPAIAVGTALTVILLTSLVGSAAYLGQGIDFGLVLILGVGSVVGAYVGAKLTRRIDKRLLTVVLACLTLAFAVYMILGS